MKKIKKVIREVYFDKTTGDEPTNDNYSLFIRTNEDIYPTPQEAEHFFKLQNKLYQGYHVISVSENAETCWCDIEEDFIYDYSEYKLYQLVVAHAKTEDLQKTNIEPFTEAELNRFFDNSFINALDVYGIYEFTKDKYILALNVYLDAYPEDFDLKLSLEKNFELMFAKDVDLIPCEIYDEPIITVDVTETGGSEYVPSKTIYVATVQCNMIVNKTDIKED